MIGPAQQPVDGAKHAVGETQAGALVKVEHSDRCSSDESVNYNKQAVETMCCTVDEGVPTTCKKGRACVPCHKKTCFFAYAKTKAKISCAVTVQLICAFVFAT